MRSGVFRSYFQIIYSFSHSSYFSRVLVRVGQWVQLYLLNLRKVQLNPLIFIESRARNEIFSHHFKFTATEKKSCNPQSNFLITPLLKADPKNYFDDTSSKCCEVFIRNRHLGLCAKGLNFLLFHKPGALLICVLLHPVF